MGDTNNGYEVAKLIAEKRFCENIIPAIKGVKIFVQTDTGMQSMDLLQLFPFCLTDEIKVLLSDAVGQYQNLINQKSTSND